MSKAMRRREGGVLCINSITFQNGGLAVFALQSDGNLIYLRMSEIVPPLRSRVPGIKQLLERGQAGPGVIERIINGPPVWCEWRSFAAREGLSFE
jgi:hypothetical protein